MTPAAFAEALVAAYPRRPAPLTPVDMALLCRLASRARRQRGGHVVLDGYRSADGYAYFRHRKRILSVHRFVYERFGGDATGLDVDHACGHRTCVVHLRALPAWQNRGWRAPAGEAAA